MAFDLASARPIKRKFDLASAKPVISASEDQSPSFLNTPTIPLTKIGGKMLDIGASLTGSGDRGVVRENLPEVYGALKSIGGKAEQLTTPINAGLVGAMSLASPAIATAAAGTFAAKAGYDLFKQAPELKKKYDNAVAAGDKVEASKILNDAAIDAGSIGLTGAHFVKNVELPRLPTNMPLRSPSVVESGVESGLKNLGDNTLPEQTGQILQKKYSQKVGTPLRDQMAELARIDAEKSSAPITPPKSGQEIFTPEYNKVAENIHPSKVEPSRSGQAIQEGSFSEFRKKYDNVQAKWDPINTEHSSKPNPLNITKEVVGKILSKEGEPSALDMLNPNLRETALEQPNPEQFAQDLLGKSKLSNPKMFAESPPEGTVETAQNVHIDPRYSKLKQIFKIANDPNTTFGQVHSLKTELGNMIDFSGRGDAVNRNLIEAYKAIDSDSLVSAEKGGFGKQYKDANLASRDFFQFRDSPISKSVYKNQGTPSQLLNNLVKKTGVETANELMTKHVTDPAQRKIVRRGLIDEISRTTNNDPVKFINKYNEFTPEVKTAFFGEDKPLIDSLAGTVEMLNKENARYASEKANRLKPLSIEKKDILSENEFKLDKMMNDENASTLVKNIVGQPVEMIRTVKKSLGDDGTKLLGRGIINQIINESKTGLTGQVQNRNLYGNMEWLRDNPEIVKEIYGKDAPIVNALTETSSFIKNKMTDISVNRTRASESVFGIKHWKLAKELFQKYRVTPQARTMLEKKYGADIAEQIIPNKKILLKPITK